MVEMSSYIGRLLSMTLPWECIHIKATVSKLENSRNMLEIVFLCILNMVNFKRLALIATEP